MADPQSGAQVDRTSQAGFFAARWAGEVPLPIVFWRDTITIGSLINIATSLLAMMLFLNGAPTWLAAATFLSPLPYNVFLTLAVWRRAERDGGGGAVGYQFGALIWLIVATLV